MAKIIVSEGGTSLVATGVGSCLIITLYDPVLKQGAMAHAMLARSVEHIADSKDLNAKRYPLDAKYVQDAIDSMLDELQRRGSKNENLEAKLVGAADMFPIFETDSISKENIIAAKKKLKQEGIKITGESVGGNIGRSVEFDPKSGIVTVSIKF